MLPLQNSVLDCKALSPEGMHPDMVYFSLAALQLMILHMVNCHSTCI